jgi:hypothetical protein
MHRIDMRIDFNARLYKILDRFGFSYGFVGCPAPSPITLERVDFQQFVFYVFLYFKNIGDAVQIGQLIDDENIKDIEQNDRAKSEEQFKGDIKAHNE